MKREILAAMGMAVLLVSLARGVDERPMPRVELDPQGIDIPQSQAIVRTLEAAAAVYVKEYDFDMPRVIYCSVAAKAGLPNRLWTDGNDRIFQQLSSKANLKKPSETGIFTLYGLCHEPGHIAMYRLLQDHDWLSGAALEGWAHYAGSVVVDRVYEQYGEKLWWQPYDYSADGTKRLDRQLTAANPSDIARGADQWRKLEKIIGKKGFAPLFRAWQAGGIDPYRPDAALPILQHTFPGHDPELAAWWEGARGLFVEPCQVSDFPRQQIALAKLAGRSQELAKDDGTADGKWAYNDVGHGRTFEVKQGGEWYLKSVRVFGARYGSAAGAERTFEVVLCDAQCRPIASWKKKYGEFARGRGGWVKLDVTPTKVPEKFVVLVVFRTSASEGVYVFYDTSTSGESVIGLAGKEASVFKQGDWMIRAEVDRAGR